MMNNQERLTIATAILNKFKKGEQLNIENHLLISWYLVWTHHLT
jgi:uncharacterized coiled-coil DUF342 family protein